MWPTPALTTMPMLLCLPLVRHMVLGSCSNISVSQDCCRCGVGQSYTLNFTSKPVLCSGYMVMDLLSCSADAAAAQWDGTPAAGFDAAAPPQTAEGADWGAPAGGFEAAPAPAPFPDGAQQYQVQGMLHTLNSAGTTM